MVGKIMKTFEYDSCFPRQVGGLKAKQFCKFLAKLGRCLAKKVYIIHKKGGGNFI